MLKSTVSDSGDSIGDNGAFKAEKEGVGGGLNQGVAVVARIKRGVARCHLDGS